MKNLAPFLVLIFWPVMSIAESPKELFLVDFFTEKDDVAPHGTLSLIDRIPRSTWTIQTDQQKQTYDTPISEEAFRDIWDKISDTKALSEYAVSDPNAKLDFRKNYVVGINFLVSGRRGQRVYLIPHDCKSDIVLTWIREIECYSKTK